MIEIIKNNQCLKIRLKYDYASGQSEFQDFVEMNDISRLNHSLWLKFGNPEAMHFTPEDLKTPTSIFDALDEVSLYADEFTMPDLTEEEFTEIFSLLAAGDVDSINLTTARRGLLSMTHQKWYESLNHYNDVSDTLAPYTYTAQGYSQGDYAHLYLIGIEEAEAEALVCGFELYAYDTPCYFCIDLIDCETGKVLDSAGLGGIYDTTLNLDHLKAELVSGIKSLSYLDDELKTLALEAVQDIDYTNIDNNF